MHELDRVRVAQLLRLERSFDGADPVMRAPQVGDSGTIVHIHYQDALPALYTVEAVDADGYTLWVADFAADELQLLTTHSRYP